MCMGGGREPGGISPFDLPKTLLKLDELHDTQHTKSATQEVLKSHRSNMGITHV